MTSIIITPLESQRFGVEISEGTVTTTHKIALPDTLVDDLGLDGVDATEIVRAAIAFLLDREPATSIRGDLPLDQIARHHPDFYAELRTRLGVA